MWPLRLCRPEIAAAAEAEGHVSGRRQADGLLVPLCTVGTSLIKLAPLL